MSNKVPFKIKSFDPSSFNERLDFFLGFVFSAFKVFSSLIVALCLLVILFLGIKYLFTGHVSLEVPSFKEIKEALESAQQPAESYSYSSLEEKREVEKRYGDVIQEIVKKYGFRPSAYDIFVRDVVELPPEYRSTFVYGLEDFLKEASKYKKKHDKEISLAELANWYRQAFKERLEDINNRKQMASIDKKMLLFAMGVVLLILLAFLIIPLLIKIEENTRNLANLANK